MAFLSHYPLRLSHETPSPKNDGSQVAIRALRWYKRQLSPLLPAGCRYVPTCSEYAVQALEQYGLLRGLLLTAWRLLRCNPTGGHGYDPPRWPPVAYWHVGRVPPRQVRPLKLDGESAAQKTHRPKR